MVRTVDVHNHLFPKVWLDYIENNPGVIKMKRTGPTTMHFYVHDQPISHINLPGHYLLEPRIEDMDKSGIDTQMLSLTTPGVEFLPPKDGVTWAKKINDAFAEASQKYPGRFYPLAALPYQDVDEALKELERAYRELKVKGLTIFSNIDGKPIASPEFFPIYEKAQEYSLPFFVHPGVPLTLDVLKKLRLSPGLWGFTLDTTMAIASLIWQGVFEKYPGLKMIHAHLGGVIPYTAQRMEDCWRTGSKEIGLDLPMTPSEYYKRQVYPDSVSAYLPAMRCCLDFVGPEHICMGTDYAHRIGIWDKAIDYIKQLNLSEEDTDNILGGNAARIFHLEKGK